jgi:prepilin signal peptidase PulO-like enzyme (type II secretory pathway)
MTLLPAAGTTLLASLGAWEIARRAARARGLAIGRFPGGVAAGAAVVVAVAGAHGGVGLATIAVVAAVGVAGVIDARCGAIFDPLTGALTTIALLVARVDGRLAAAVPGAAFAGGALLALHVLTRGRGIGLGDVKLAAGIGAGLGVAGGALALGGAFLFGAWLLATRRARRGARLHFGPFLAAGTCVAVLAPVFAPVFAQ